MRRRGFITVLGGAAAWPLLGHAQLPERVRRVGVLIPFPENDPNTQGYMKAFAQALGRLGWVEGNNIRIDYRFAAGDPTLFKTYAAELVGQSPDAILATSSAAVDALRKQTRTIPIVLATVADPVGQGFAQSLARPGGNITGFSAPDASVMGKWLQLLKEIAPRVTRVAVIFNPDTAIYAPSSAPVIEAAAQSLGITVTLAAVHNESEIEEAVAIEARQPGGGLFILTDVFNITHRDAIIAAAAHHMLPLIGQPPLV